MISLRGWIAGLPIAVISSVSPASSLAQPLPRFVDRSAASKIEIITYSGSVEKPHILDSTVSCC